MSDYLDKHKARANWYSHQAVVERDMVRDEAKEQAEIERQAQRVMAFTLPTDKDPKPNVFGGTGDKGSLFKKGGDSNEGSLTGQLGDAAAAGKAALDTLPNTADKAGMLAGEVGEHGLDALGGIGHGLLNMADQVLDLGAHALGFEQAYTDFAKWVDTNGPTLYEPQTLSGQVSSPVAQVAAPYTGSLKLLQAAKVNSVFSRVIVAGGVAEGVALSPTDDNIGDLLQRFEDVSPETLGNVREALVDALAKTPEELEQLARGDMEMAGDGNDELDAMPFDADAYREAYFESRLKNAVSGMVIEGVGEGVLASARGLFHTTRAFLQNPKAALQLAQNATETLVNAPFQGPSGRFGASERGYVNFTKHREDNPSSLDAQTASARQLLASGVEASEDLAIDIERAKANKLNHAELTAMLPPETRRSGELPQGRHTTVAGGRFVDLDLKAAPGHQVTDDALEASWQESLSFMRRQGYDVDSIVGKLRSHRDKDGNAVKSVKPKGAEFWNRAFSMPDGNRARFWYEVSAEGMRDLLPDLEPEAFKMFIDMVAITSQSTAPTQNMMRALGVLSHSMRAVPSEQDIIDPTLVLGAMGQANEGLKVGSFGGTFLHHLGLRDMPQLSTNDRQVASTFGMGATDIANNPVMYGVLSRFYQNMRDQLNANLPEGAEPWETWQLQAIGWVQERVDNGNTDFDDYMDVLQKVGARAAEAGVPMGPNGEFTREALMDPRLDPILATTIEDYRKKVKLGLPVTSRGGDYRASIALRREKELAGDRIAVDNWYAMERRAIKSVMQRTEQQVVKDGQPVFTAKGERKTEKAPSPASQLAHALLGGSKDKAEITRTSVASNEAGYASRLPLPSSANELQVRAFLSVMGESFGLDKVRAGRFEYSGAQPPADGQAATSVLYEHPEPLKADQVRAFQDALGSDWQVDAHTAPNGSTLDVHPKDGEAADPDQLEKALEAAGLDAGVAQVVWSRYEGVQVPSQNFSRNVGEWKRNVVRSEAEKLARQVGGMRLARQLVVGTAELPDDAPGGQALRKKIATARANVAAQLKQFEDARALVKGVRANLDADAKAYVEGNGRPKKAK